MKILAKCRTFALAWFEFFPAVFFLDLFVATTAEVSLLLNTTAKNYYLPKVNEFNHSKTDEHLAYRVHRAKALSDICGYYGNQLLTMPQSARGQAHTGDVTIAEIWVTHELFDTAEGLIPHLTYRVDFGLPSNNSINHHVSSVYILQASAGQLVPADGSSDLCENHEHGTRRSIMFSSLLSGAIWSVNAVTDSPYKLNIWITRYNIDDDTYVEIANSTFTVLPECFLKFRVKHGTFTSLQLPWGMESSGPHHQALMKYGCRLLWSIPIGSSIELTLRKLKMPKTDRRLCQDDNQMQWASLSSESFLNSSATQGWTILSHADWKVSRSFCGKLQEQPKNMRTWRSSDPFVMIRTPIVTQHWQGPYSDQKQQSFISFAVKFHVMGPCSNPLYTDHSMDIKLLGSDLANTAPECSFRIHLPYGLRVQLTATLVPLNVSNTLSGTTSSNSNEDHLENNLLLIRSGRCPIAVQLEDVSGTKVECLYDGRARVAFSSQTNILTFRALVVGHGEKEGNVLHPIKRAESSSTGTAGSQSSNHLEVSYKAIPDDTLSHGCDAGIAVNENACIFLVDEALSWHEAEAKCNLIAPGGHLAAITHSSIQDAVDALIINSVSFEPNKAYWIGANDQKRESYFEWSDGKSFRYSKWFSGWSQFHDYGAQPSDDGMSNQDCVEIRHTFRQPDNIDAMTNGLYWNDRDCASMNPFVCQKPRNSGEIKLTPSQETFLCNRTEELTRLLPRTIVHSPLFPNLYPSSTTCVVNLNGPQGFRIVLSFNHFDLEEEDDCNYDSLELFDYVDQDAKSEVNMEKWKRCGNWNTRLKLLQWRSNTNRISIRFSSDDTHTSTGFELVASLERSDYSCAVGNNIYQQDKCFLIVPFPSVKWEEARQACRTAQAELAVVGEDNHELHYLLDQINKEETFKDTSRYWIGQADKLELSVSSLAYVPSECPLLLNNVTSNKSLTLEACSSSSGYICRILPKSNSRIARNASIESREGDVKSPNYPEPYGDDNHFQLHIKLPNTSSSSERLVVYFKMIDLEFQDECLYDYVGLQSVENGPMKKICGRYTKYLERLTFISETSEVWLTFHSDFSIVGGGFHAAWSSLKLFGCPSEKITNPKGELFSPNFPNHVLPNMNCTFKIIAPERHRIWIKFLVLEIGLQNVRRQQLPCRDDYVRLSWGSHNNVILCGSYNLTRENLQWASDGSELSVQLVSKEGTFGKGFHAVYQFEPIPTVLEERVFLYEPTISELYPLNYPLHHPNELRHRVTYVTRPGFYILFTGAYWLGQCDGIDFTILTIVVQDFYGNSSITHLCRSSEEQKSKAFQYESVFHTLTLEFLNHEGNWSAPLGHIEIRQDENYLEKLSATSESSPVELCDPNPCQNEGTCRAINGEPSTCECSGAWRGIFCSLTLCQLPSSCHHGSCVTANATDRCVCEAGYTGVYCDIPLAPCDLEPCGDRGKCVSTADSFICQCNPWWQGPRCETRWQQVPYKPLSQRMLEEPFWLGLMTIAIVLLVIAIVWCAKRHFAEKFDRFVNEELERGKFVEPPLMDWSHGRQAGHRLSILEPNTTSRPLSPNTFLSVPGAETTTNRQFLGWSSFRKPSLLSITSLVSPSQSHLSVGAPISAATRPTRNTAGSRRGGRTFSLDDLFRLPKRSPSPCKRGSDNDVTTQRREIERQQILQRLIASQIPNRNQAAKAGEMVAMTPLGRSITTVDHSTDNEIAESNVANQLQLQLDLKAEKKVTFARMMEAVKAERSSSETDTSVGEDLTKSRESANKGGICADYRPGQSKRKHRGWNSRRFWRSNNSNSSTQGSASDHDTQESTSSTVHYLVADDAAGSSALRKGHRHLRLSGRMTSNNLQQPAGNDSLLSIIRNISGSNNRTPSTPSSPQISDYEISSSFPTPLSTPGSPAGSLEVISQISIGGEMQVAVVDPTTNQRNNRTAPSCLSAPHITLEIPSSNYGQFLSPIREVPTPLPSPAHTPIPSLKRPERFGSLSASPLCSPQRKELKRPNLQYQKEELHSSDESFKGVHTHLDDSTSPDSSEHRQKKSISITVPIRIHIESPQSSPASSPKTSPVPSPAKTKPPPLNIRDSNFKRFENLCSDAAFQMETSTHQLPTLFVSEATPDHERHTELPKTVTAKGSKPGSRKFGMNWDNVDIGSPPLRKHPVDTGTLPSPPSERRTLKDINDKSSSLDFPQPPPLITITASFCQFESDIDPPMLGRSSFDAQSKMSYLSPFACYNMGKADIAASESNLSSSGYSSMASPGPSPSCSSRALSILEEDLVLHRFHARKRGLLSRILLSPSLESSSSPPDSPPEHAGNNFEFLNRVLATTDSETSDIQISVPEIQVDDLDLNFSYPTSDDTMFHLDIKNGERECQEFLDNGHAEANPTQDDVKRIDNPNEVNSQGVRKYAQTFKSVSLDSKAKGMRRSNLKGDSLDTKLQNVQAYIGHSSFGLQLPDIQPLKIPETSEDHRRGSPVSSRSESPLSDAKSVGLGRFSSQFYGMSRNDIPYTDSDGLYDYPSSETVLPRDASRRLIRKADRRRDRRTNQKAIYKSSSNGNDVGQSLLDPNVDRGGNRLISKRRMRAQHINFQYITSSSSSDSIEFSQKRRGRKIHSPQILATTSENSPRCDVVLTFQAASSPEVSSEGDEKCFELPSNAKLKKVCLSSKKQTRNKVDGISSSDRRRLHDGSKKRRDHLGGTIHGYRTSKKKGQMSAPEVLDIKDYSSTSTSTCHSDYSDTDESLANLTEIDESVDAFQNDSLNPQIKQKNRERK